MALNLFYTDLAQQAQIYSRSRRIKKPKDGTNSSQTCSVDSSYLRKHKLTLPTVFYTGRAKQDYLELTFSTGYELFPMRKCTIWQLMFSRGTQMWHRHWKELTRTNRLLQKKLPDVRGSQWHWHSNTSQITGLWNSLKFTEATTAVSPAVDMILTNGLER